MQAFFVPFPPAPSVMPTGPLCHARGLLAGIQRLSLPSLSSGDPAWEKPMDSRLNTSGMTEGGLNTSGRTEGPLGSL